ncbi:hypothetical protein BCR37DRAFT_384290 [Protomyces lactucae-debilis]|uniref:Secreted protein n=1 Tax=Protomyces lactucae-debilis TaxID=2754530 RepID=A0A1Y2EVJ6_PROLT|nr:uncharacterized protein BCR37DRAFT_384290 [Protomyces lactucae-debilis]ORY74855.1 hypothetical protein BCR37DRAFT_384290 [Protomyces lactucae-debilis]
MWQWHFTLISPCGSFTTLCGDAMAVQQPRWRSTWKLGMSFLTGRALPTTKQSSSTGRRILRSAAHLLICTTRQIFHTKSSLCQLAKKFTRGLSRRRLSRKPRLISTRLCWTGDNFPAAPQKLFSIRIQGQCSIYHCTCVLQSTTNPPFACQD